MANKSKNENARSYLNSQIVFQDVYNLFIESKGVKLSDEQVFDVLISPFYTVDPLERFLIRHTLLCICLIWVQEGKLRKSTINDEVVFFCT